MKLKAWSETERKKLEQLQKQLTDLHSARDADICRETVYYESGGDLGAGRAYHLEIRQRRAPGRGTLHFQRSTEFLYGMM